MTQDKENRITFRSGDGQVLEGAEAWAAAGRMGKREGIREKYRELCDRVRFAKSREEIWSAIVTVRSYKIKLIQLRSNSHWKEFVDLVFDEWSELLGYAKDKIEYFQVGSLSSIELPLVAKTDIESTNKSLGDRENNLSRDGSSMGLALYANYARMKPTDNDTSEHSKYLLNRRADLMKQAIAPNARKVLAKNFELIRSADYTVKPIEKLKGQKIAFKWAIEFAKIEGRIDVSDALMANLADLERKYKNKYDLQRESMLRSGGQRKGVYANL